MNESLDEWYYFATPVYTIKITDFLDVAKEVSEEYLDKIKSVVDFDEVYPMYQTDQFTFDTRLDEFRTFIEMTAWDILYNQGYYMDDRNMLCNEMWLQSHHKYSSMDIHTHGYGSQISGFYILECDEYSPKICIHDPRHTKTQTDLMPSQSDRINDATRIVEFDAEPGKMFFTNSWLPHSFTRNRSNKPFKFIHFNVYDVYKQLDCDLPIVI